MTPTEQREAGTCIRMQEEPQLRVPTKFDEWRAEGEELARRKKGLTAGFWQLQFDVGDWLIECENYGEGEAITGYSASTLRTFVYVARHVPFNLRYVSLPWGIHQLVAPFKSDDDKQLFLQSRWRAGSCWQWMAGRSDIRTAQHESDSVWGSSHCWLLRAGNIQRRTKSQVRCGCCAVWRASCERAGKLRRIQ